MPQVKQKKQIFSAAWETHDTSKILLAIIMQRVGIPGKKLPLPTLEDRCRVAVDPDVLLAHALACVPLSVDYN